MKKYLEEKVKHLAPSAIKKMRGEASNRAFFRVYLEKYSLAAMVYPTENRAEIDKIIRLTELYRQHGIPVPNIHEVIDDRIILQEDLGDTLVQRFFKNSGKTGKTALLQEIAALLVKLAGIPASATAAVLGHERMKWEMDFFIQHFIGNFFPPSVHTPTEEKILKETLYDLVEKINNITCFAHRDFHSRNMLYHRGTIYLVDFQDSLVASPYYDLVSFAYDAYLDPGPGRELLIKEYERLTKKSIDFDQLYLSALQRNIKALGTFGYQVFERKNLVYKKYINRTISYIVGNIILSRLPGRKPFPFPFSV